MTDAIDLDTGFLIRHKHLVLHLEPDPSGGYVVTSPFVPGLVTQGETFEDAVAMALDADVALREARADLRKRAHPPAPADSPAA